MSTAGKPLKARHIPIREDWLALRTEPAIDPERPIIDAHHHLWDKSGNRYLLADIEADLASGHNLVATIFVEGRMHYREGGDPALQSLGETEMANDIAEVSARRHGGPAQVAAGIIGFVDLTLGERAGEVLDRHREAAKGRFCGVRNTSAWHADPEARGSIVSPPADLLADAAFRRGFAELAPRQLVFDAWLYHTQHADLADLAGAFPQTRIVINHQGGPIGIGPYAGRRDEVFEAWRRSMRDLAAHRNIAVKLGGLGMLMAGFDFEDRELPPTSDDLAAAWGPYFAECIEIFGAARCMFESNFPVDKGTASYVTVWNAFKKVAEACTEAEKNALFFETANMTYRLDIAPASAAGAQGPAGREQT